MDEAVFTSWPVDGSAPALTFYFNRNDSKTYDVSDNLRILESKFFSNETQKTLIGYIEITEVFTSYTINEIVNFTFTSSAGGGSISMQDNRIGTKEDDRWADNSQYIFRITDGNGPYQFVQGYIVIDTDDQGGRFIKVYFGINKSVPAY